MVQTMLEKTACKKPSEPSYGGLGFDGLLFFSERLGLKFQVFDYEKLISKKWSEKTSKPRLYLLLFAFLVLFSLNFSKSEASSTNETVYNQLIAHGFPAGLLPETATDYSLQSDGRFVVHLQDVCAVTLKKTYHVTYSSTISGHLAYGAISHLSGISVKEFFFNFAVTAIYVSGNNLLFEVGLISATFSMSVFDESPVCRSDVSMNSFGFSM